MAYHGKGKAIIVLDGNIKIMRGKKLAIPIMTCP